MTADLATTLTHLRLPVMRDAYDELAQQAVAESWSYQHFLAQLTTLEWEQRLVNRHRRRIQEARFPLHKELAHFLFERIPALDKRRIMTLAEGAYVAAADPIILIGNPGLGKTHIAIGLGLAACRMGKRVRFYTVTQLVNALTSAHNEHQLQRLIDKLLRHDLLILDEFGYVPFSTTGAQLLFQCLSALNERTAVIITTNLPFGEWQSVLIDQRLTSGLLDRLTFNSHIIEFVGESYRFQSQLDTLSPQEVVPASTP